MHKYRNNFLHFVVIFIVCIDQGDGHWKERDKENLQHDIDLYRKMAEKIEREIESFYDEYPEGRYKNDNVDRLQYKHITNIQSSKILAAKVKHGDKIKNTLLNLEFSNITKGVPINHNINENDLLGHSNLDNSKSGDSRASWPKFEDILLAMGKKYDWKNDRWIKVKEKIKTHAIKEKIDSKVGDNNSIKFHEKHKFSYRMVKLKSKSRRNIVVAVSAVR